MLLGLASFRYRERLDRWEAFSLEHRPRGDFANVYKILRVMDK